MIFGILIKAIQLSLFISLHLTDHSEFDEVACLNHIMNLIMIGFSQLFSLVCSGFGSNGSMIVGRFVLRVVGDNAPGKVPVIGFKYNDLPRS